MSAAASRKRVICVGHAALDRVFCVESWPAGSGKIPAHRFEESGGGMAANAAAAIARLGGEAVFWGPTGDDAIATAIHVHFVADGVDATWLRRFDGRTSSHSAVIVDERGERLVVGLRGSALQAPADWLPLGQVGQSRALLADVRWPDGALRVTPAFQRSSTGRSPPGKRSKRLSVRPTTLFFPNAGSRPIPAVTT